LKKIIISFFIFAVISSANASEKIVLTTLDWEPYIGQSMKQNGYVAVLVKEAFRRGGYNAEFKFYKWGRVVGLAKAGKVDGYFPEYYSDAVKSYAKFSIPFPGGPIGFFKLKKSKIKYRNLKDLKPYKIGVVRGYVNTKEFDSASYLRKDLAQSELTNFKKLVAGRIDLLVADKFVGLELIKKHMPEKAAQIEFISETLEEKDLYVCISKKGRDSDKIVKAFNYGLKKMKADGTVTKILKQFGFK
jgi:polar amino acid transport system substrate-binding protein